VEAEALLMKEAGGRSELGTMLKYFDHFFGHALSISNTLGHLIQNITIWIKTAKNF